MKVVRLSVLDTSRLFPPGNIPGTYFCWRLGRPQRYSTTGRIKSVTNPKDLIGNQTRFYIFIEIYFCNTFMILCFMTYSVVLLPIFLVLVSSCVCTHFKVYKRRGFISSNDIRFWVSWLWGWNWDTAQSLKWFHEKHSFKKRKPCSQVGYISSVNIFLCLGITNKCIHFYQFIISLCCSYVSATVCHPQGA
jgi:hypothetical protein